MAQLHIDEATAERCRDAIGAAQPITVSGLDFHDRVRMVTGMVQSIRTDHSRGPGRHYVVTIFEGSQSQFRSRP